ncbi:hypothetical protein [Fibrobacter sp. UBA3629]|uniref:hypothetical protein n=1 Tax=Fibrobacter sp. UBA3629 TaxID=1946530 RepID=UPI0025C39AF1|nr:hypothetical protein [Fibrobacter sp. UBA3629]
MNKLFLASLVAMTAFASAEVLTYTATSKKSQKEADQLALEGLAKQLRTKVSSEFETTVKEDSKGKVTSTAKGMKSTSTSMTLKGAKLTQGPKSKGAFQSTATIDTDLMASKILMDLNSIRAQMKSKDSIIRFDMVDRDYRKMGVDMVALEKLADSYTELLEDLSCVQKIPKEMKLESTLGELKEYLISGMSSLKIETDLTSEALMVTVTDFAGPVKGFPLALTQDSRDIAHEKTNDEGEAVFSLAQVKKLHPAGEVMVHADLNFRYVRAAVLLSQTVRYDSEKAACTYRLVCDGPVEACGALKSFLADAGITLLDKESLPALNAKLQFTDKMNTSKTLCTSRGTVTLGAFEQQTTESVQGVGRDEGIAQATAVKKLPATKLNQMFGKACQKK